MNNDELIANIDKAINDLVYDKTQIIKAYNYYHGKRDPEQFKHLEENYGIGTPTSVEFVPLVRKHIDVLIGEYLSIPVLPKVSCKDSRTLTNIYKDKQIKLHREIAGLLNKHLKETLRGDSNKGALNVGGATNIELEISALKEAFESNFISDYEIAAQNIVDWIVQSRDIDFLNKKKQLLTDLLISGTCYFKKEKSQAKSNVNFKVCNPINSFVDKNDNSPYLKDSSRSVVREYLTKDQILAKYGDDLKKEDLDTLNSWDSFNLENSDVFVRGFDTIHNSVESNGILGGFEVSPILPTDRFAYRNNSTHPVYEVEFLKAEIENKEYIMNRYSGVRIGNSIYITYGKDEEVSRSIDNPKMCSLDINGIFYSNKNGDPFSLILATANLQDKFDVLNFYRDNIIAESGTVGDWVDIAYLPKVLGSELPERLLKWKAYKKQGLALIDSSQEGLPPMNTTFGGFDDSIKLQSIQAVDLAMQRIEDTCSNITGVFRERLGGIEQRDAVTNVQIGVENSSLITKQHFYTMDLITREILLDLLNLAKIVYKNGMSGTLILGTKLNKIFTALPEYYTLTDHDIHISDSSEVMKEKELLERISMEFIKNNAMDPEIVIELITSTGLTSMKADVKEALSKKRTENDYLGKLKQEVDALNQQLKQAANEAQRMERDFQFLNSEKIKLEQEKLEFSKELEWYKARNQKEYNESKLELDKKRVDLEALQLIDVNKKNDEIKNN